LLDEGFNLKIADFGLATDVGKFTFTIAGTEGYLPPESLNKNGSHVKNADLFAAAICLFIMYTGNPPFRKAKLTDPYYKLIAFKKPRFWNAHQKYKKNFSFDNDFRDLMHKMLDFSS